MVAKVFINLPVKNLEKSISFFTHIGFSFDPHVTDENAACMIINGNVFFVILLKEDYFKTFVTKAICDTSAFTEVLITLHIDSKESIQIMIEKARMLGAIIPEPEDRGWMYQNSLTDLDGHQWEFIFIDNDLLPDQG